MDAAGGSEMLPLHKFLGVLSLLASQAPPSGRRLPFGLPARPHVPGKDIMYPGSFALAGLKHSSGVLLKLNEIFGKLDPLASLRSAEARAEAATAELSGACKIEGEKEKRALRRSLLETLMKVEDFEDAEQLLKDFKRRRDKRNIFDRVREELIECVGRSPEMMTKLTVILGELEPLASLKSHDAIAAKAAAEKLSDACNINVLVDQRTLLYILATWLSAKSNNKAQSQEKDVEQIYNFLEDVANIYKDIKLSDDTDVFNRVVKKLMWCTLHGDKLTTHKVLNAFKRETETGLAGGRGA